MTDLPTLKSLQKQIRQPIEVPNSLYVILLKRMRKDGTISQGALVRAVKEWNGK